MSDLIEKDLLAIDHRYIWHPFTQSKHWVEDAPAPIIERGVGVTLFDTAGRAYLDGVSSLWCNVHGHSVPELLAALHTQVDKLCHSTMLGLTHRPIIELTKELVKILPPGLTKIFYADDGSTAVEAGLRMALEWWQKKGDAAAKKRTKLLSLGDAYHGDTLGAVGVGFLKTFHEHCESAVIPALRITPPHARRIIEGLPLTDAEQASLEELKNVLSKHGEEIAAFVVEPLVQGAAGIWIHSAGFLQAAAAMCKQRGILIIADEVATGFGKTGSMFATVKAGIEPDILIVGKGLSGGYLPISAAIAREEIFAGFIGPVEEHKTFYYGQTFAGNPLAAAVAKANIELFESSNLLTALQPKIAHFQKELTNNILPLDAVFEIRQEGVMVGIELTAKPGSLTPFATKDRIPAQIVREARERGAIIRPLGNVIVLMPPLAISAEQISSLVSITKEAIIAGINWAGIN